MTAPMIDSLDSLDSVIEALPALPTLPTPVRLPRNLAEVRSFLCSLPSDESINMYSQGACLGARLIRALNPGADEVHFLYSSFTVRMPCDAGRDVWAAGERQVYLIGEVGAFFKWLFAAGSPVHERHNTGWGDEADHWTVAELVSELDRYLALHV